MLVLKEEKQTELVIKKSRFIAIAKICNSIKDVKAIVEQTRKLYPDSNHVVHAAVVGNEFSFSDDKEPKNTAGRPALEVLKGSKITNICVLVVRYFGGTLLGTGGLVKAYGDSVKAVLENIQTEELIQKCDFEFSIPYSLHDSAAKAIENLTISEKSEQFETDIKVSGKIAVEEKEKLSQIIAELTNGNCKVLFK